MFIQWLQEFVYLEDAGYWAVALVGMRLLLRVVNPEWVPPEWAMISLIAVLFIWGFSRRTSEIPMEAQSSSMDKMSYELVE